MGACVNKESPAEYNIRVSNALGYLNLSQPSFAYIDEGLNEKQKSCILVEKGRFVGMGYIPNE